MINITHSFNEIIVGSDIRAIILSFLTRRPVFLVNYKEAKVCDFYYTPFCFLEYTQKTNYRMLFEKEQKLNSFEYRKIYPKNILETDLSCLLSMEGLIFSGYTNLKIISENEFMLFGKKYITKVFFKKCIMTDPSFDISFLDVIPVEESKINKTYTVYDYFYFNNTKLDNTYKLFQNGMNCWILRNELADVDREVDCLLVTHRTIPYDDLGAYTIDEIKSQIHSVNNIKYKRLFPHQTYNPHDHIREMHDNKKLYLYKNTDTISFIYNSDTDIIKRFANENTKKG